MSRNTSLLGRRVEVVYHFGAIELFASGVLLGDADESILIEQDADQYGSLRVFQLKIPWSWIIRLNESHSDRKSAAS